MSKDLSPWGPRHAAEPTHDKTYDVASALGVHPMQAYGHVSAFRARVLVEAPSGRLRGGPDQVERLALWDGARGALAKAFLEAGIVDEVDGVLVAHEHDLYGGASIEKRKEAVARTTRWREKKKESERERNGDVNVDVTPSLSSSDLSSSDLNSGSSGGGAGDGQVSPVNRGRMNPDAPAPLPGRLLPKTGRQGGWQAGKPFTVEELFRQPEGQALRKEYPALDGQKGRPRVEDVVGAMWDNFATWTWPTTAMSKLRTYLAQHHAKYREAYLRDGGVIADVKPAARSASPDHVPVETDFEAELAKLQPVAKVNR